MKKITFLMGVLCTLASYAQTTPIPDSNFEQALVDQGIDSDGTLNGEMPTADASGVTHLIIDSLDISDLTGIEIFTDLTYLDFRYNSISSVDLSQNTLLDTLICTNNWLSSIDVSALSNLEAFIIRNNALSTIDVSNNFALEILGVDGNNLTNLDLFSNTQLQYVYCSYNDLFYLDVTNNLDLIHLYCHKNSLQSLDLSQNQSLEVLYIGQNFISTLDLSTNNNLTSVHGQIGALNNVIFGNCDSLNTVSLDFNNLDSINVTTCPNLTFLSIIQNNISEIDLSQNTNLNTFNADQNNFKELDLSNNPLLTSVHMSDLPSLEIVDLKNGGNTTTMGNDVQLLNCTNLNCVQVDDSSYSATNWIYIDDPALYSEDCNLDLGFTSQSIVFSIYPTVVDNNLNLEVNTPGNYKIYSLDGKVVAIGNMYQGYNIIDASDLPSGMYIFELNSDENRRRTKIVKK